MASFKATDLKDSEKLQKLLQRINDDPSIIDEMPEDELAHVENLVSPYGTVAEANVQDSWTCLSFTNLRKEYLQKLLTTANIAYLYRRCDEYGRSFKDTVDFMDDMKVAEKKVIASQKELVKVEAKIITDIRKRNELKIIVKQLADEEEKNKLQYNTGKQNVTKERMLEMREHQSKYVEQKDLLRIANQNIAKGEKKRDELQGLGKRFIIRQFLDEQYNFNPDKHIRSSYLEQAKSSTGTTYASKFVPPDEFFHNFQYYMDSNYEELLGVTNTLYKVKPDLDVGIIPYGTFTNQEEADSFVERNKTGTIASIITLKNGKWNFIESYKANRDRIEAYRGTIVEDILQQVKDDMKIGSELTRDRAIRRRTENIKETRPDPKMIKDYMANRGKADTGDAGCDTELTGEEQEEIHRKHVEEREAAEQKLLDVADDDKEEAAPHGTVRVNVFNFTDGGKDVKKTHFYTKAKAPESNVPDSRHPAPES